MKISELTKGTKAFVPALGKVLITSVTKKYIKVKQLEFNNIICKISFACDAAPISDIPLVIE